MVATESPNPTTAIEAYTISLGNNARESAIPQTRRIVPLRGIFCFSGLPHLHRKVESEDGSLFFRITKDVAR
ncbi:hypothetical protein SDC9_180105 [bioreactor metagenome]|uniref:Uncharacterized protein n=1 Tax=bioreactor metagenome TaxID=1076179 RepID=A0A645H0Q5_9ZZZZ